MFQLLAPLVAPLLGAGGAAAAGTAAAGAGSSLLSGMATSMLMGGVKSLLGGAGGGSAGGGGIPTSVTGMSIGQAPQLRPAMNLSPTAPMGYAGGGIMDVPQASGSDNIAAAVAAAGLQPDQRTLGLVAMLVDKGATVEQAIDLLLRKESGVSNIPAPPPGETPQMAAAMDRGGMIRGPGTGVQDLIEGTIDNRQKVLLSDGEFVVPARVVSALGDGSSEAGAKVLHGMMERVKADAAKNLKTNGEIKPEKVLPA